MVVFGAVIQFTHLFGGIQWSGETSTSLQVKAMLGITCRVTIQPALHFKLVFSQSAMAVGFRVVSLRKPAAYSWPFLNSPPRLYLTNTVNGYLWYTPFAVALWQMNECSSCFCRLIHLRTTNSRVRIARDETTPLQVGVLWLDKTHVNVISHLHTENRLST